MKAINLTDLYILSQIFVGHYIQTWTWTSLTSVGHQILTKTDIITIQNAMILWEDEVCFIVAKEFFMRCDLKYISYRICITIFL
jgi:hypothetical protein